MSGRAETTEFLKECLADALFMLLEDRPLSDITVTDIAKKAQVGRATYFRHFSSKYDPMLFKLLLLWDRWMEGNEIPPHPPARRLLGELFGFCSTYREHLRLILENGGQDVVSDMFLGITHTHAFEQADADVAAAGYLRRAFCLGMTGIIIEWCDRGFVETTDELVAMLGQTMRAALASSLG